MGWSFDLLETREKLEQLNNRNLVGFDGYFVALLFRTRANGDFTARQIEWINELYEVTK